MPSRPPPEDLPEIVIVGPDGESELQPPGPVTASGLLAELQARDSSSPARRSKPSFQSGRGPIASSLFPKRAAQVVQGSRLAVDRVLNLLAEPALWSEGDRLWVDAGSVRVQAGEHLFRARLRMGFGLHRAVQLRIYPTPSVNLTVFELLPRRRWMPQTSRYLRAGVPAVTELTDRLEAAAMDDSGGNAAGDLPTPNSG